MFGTDFEFLYKAKLLKFFILFCIAQFKLYLLVLCADVLEIFSEFQFHYSFHNSLISYFLSLH